jgi:hypothetical protein
LTFVDNHDGTATLSGTPDAAAAGTYTFHVAATSGALPPATQTFTLVVNQPPIITSENGATFTIGHKGSFAVTTTGFPAATLGGSGKLPGGVTFTAGKDGTATLAGTPAAGTSGTYLFTITADNGVLPPSVQLFTLTIAA